MKKTFTLWVGLLLIGCSHLFGQKYYMASPEGFGAATTGGGNATPTTVSTYSALKTALTASGSAVILVSGTIDFNTGGGMMKIIIKDKTLIGLPGAKFVNTNQDVSGILYLNTGSSNVIIRNILFEGPGARDNNGNDNLTIKPATNVWVDHCEFQDGEDGNLDNSGLTDNVTISWCKFTYLKAARPAGPNGGTTNDHRFSNLIGGAKDDAPADGNYSITWQNCWWGPGCVERMPRARNAELHILNCFYNSGNAKAALGIGGGTVGGATKTSTCYVENCDFSKLAIASFKSYTSSDGGKVMLTYSGCLNASGAGDGPATKPSYSTSSFDASLVEAAVTGPCGAGATLNVTASGVISSSCFSSDIASTDISSSSSLVYPNPSSGSFSVKGREAIKTLSIINAAGTTVYTKENLQAGMDTEITAELSDGIYFVKLQNISGSTEMIKFVKSK